jgi:dUTP pyrophosphatase
LWFYITGVNYMEYDVRFEYRITHPDAKPPYRSRDTDAGYDLSSVAAVEILPDMFEKIPVGLQISAPSGYYYTMESRSGMLSKGLVVRKAIIDAAYTGDLFVLIHNHGTISYKINVGDRIAQILPHKIIHVEFLQRNEFSPDYNIRGIAGWGSSGK